MLMRASAPASGVPRVGPGRHRHGCGVPFGQFDVTVLQYRRMDVTPRKVQGIIILGITIGIDTDGVDGVLGLLVGRLHGIGRSRTLPCTGTGPVRGSDRSI